MTRTAKACWIVAAKRAEIRNHSLPSLYDGDALVRTLYTGISRGTESLVFHQRVPPSEYQRMRAPFQDGEFPGPVKYGYINVGRVEEGPAGLVGREVFSLFPHQTEFVIPAKDLALLPESLPAERAVLAAGMETALNVLWDAEVKIGDRVAIVGAGVIGSLCGYLASRMPGTSVQLIDCNEGRRALASTLGCEFSLPADCDDSFDLVIHTSGSASGLQTSLGIAGQESRVMEVSWYGDREIPLSLGQGFHSRRLQLLSSQVGTIPAAQRSRWDYARRLQCALRLLSDPCLDSLISGESEFSDLPRTLTRVCASADELCHRIRYP